MGWVDTNYGFPDGRVPVGASRRAVLGWVMRLPVCGRSIHLARPRWPFPSHPLVGGLSCGLSPQEKLSIPSHSWCHRPSRLPPFLRLPPASQSPVGPLVQQDP